MNVFRFFFLIFLLRSSKNTNQISFVEKYFLQLSTIFCFKCHTHKTCLTIDDISSTIAINMLNSSFENHTNENDMFKCLNSILIVAKNHL